MLEKSSVPSSTTAMALENPKLALEEAQLVYDILASSYLVIGPFVFSGHHQERHIAILEH